MTHCTAGTKTCKGAVLAVCNATGSAWVAKACDDGDACTADNCDAKALACSATATVCDDGNPCTADACDAILGCQHGKEAVADGDKDGFVSKGCGGDDCDDTKKAVNPNVKEDCATIGVDDNCDGKTDEGCDVFTCEKDGDACGGKGKCSGGHCFWTNSVGYKFTLVPGGNFWMGCNAAVDSSCALSWADGEKPQHQVLLSPYWIGAFEVTTVVYELCLKANWPGCSAPAAGSTLGQAYDLPINKITWKQARRVCQWLAGDLPSEAQWEKAARGGCALYPGQDCAKAMPKFPWGNDQAYCGKTAACGDGAPSPVGKNSVQGQSPYGAFDMAGNVDEWQLDYYSDYAANAAVAKDPIDIVPNLYLIHARRGGNYEDVHVVYNDFGLLRASSRFTTIWNGEFEGSATGVRCAHAFP